MTSTQIVHAIDEALDKLDLSEHDFIHQLVLVSEDLEVGMPFSKAQAEVAEIIEEADVGEFIAEKITEALVVAILADTE